MPAPFQSSALYESPGILVSGIDAEISKAMDWGPMLKPEMNHLVLNLSGHGVILGDHIRLGIVPGTVSLLRTVNNEFVHASRLASDGRHRFAILSSSQKWLRDHFGMSIESMHPIFQDPPAKRPIDTGHLRSMSLAERDLCELLLHPPVARALRPTWFLGKILECFSIFGSAPLTSNSGNDSHQQRIDEATVWLREHFRDDLDLLSVAKHVGCAPHYLSRLFKQHSGKTMSQKLREIRIDHAATLLRDGSCNVTEAAFEVGYNSLSHFTKAFVAEKGVRPSEWKSS